MLRFFKGGSSTPATTASQPQATPSQSEADQADEGAVSGSLPLPEVTEGNEDSDWALWEDSVAFQDSQMPSGLTTLESVRESHRPVSDTRVDPFATVRRRGD